MMTFRHAPLLLILAASLAAMPAAAQTPPQTPAPTTPDQTPQKPGQTPAPAPGAADAGPTTDAGPLIIKKKSTDAPEPPPPAPDQDKIKNPGGQTFSLRVDVPIVSLDVNVILDKTHQFVPGLKPANFLILEDGVEQQVESVRMTQTPITAVMLLEFASTNYNYIRDMFNTSVSFYHSLQPKDYVAVITFDLKTHILTDFTNNKDQIAEALRSLMIPTFSEVNTFDALYETLDRTSRIEGRKYIILIGSGRDTFSKITLDKILAKIKATPNVTIFSIGTGALANEMSSGMGRGMGGGMAQMNTLQAQNQLKTFAAMTGGMYFYPLFQGELPDIFSTINNSIRNQYVVTYKPTNNKNDGTYRHVKVLLVDNEGKPLKMQDEKQRPVKYSVIARDGYNAKRPVE
jgi:VWFA-related protein